jgi:hypothetical protein
MFSQPFACVNQDKIIFSVLSVTHIVSKPLQGRNLLCGRSVKSASGVIYSQKMKTVRDC